MTRQIRILEKHEAELRERGVLHMRIFRSVAQDGATPVSDVDLLTDSDPQKKIGLLAVGSLQVRLSETFETDVEHPCADG